MSSSWKSLAAKLTVLVAPFVVAWVDPGSAFKGTDAGVVLSVSGVIAFALIHAVQIFVGDLDKGDDLSEIFSDERNYYESEAKGLQEASTRLLGSLDTIKGVPQVVTDLRGDVAKVLAYITTVESGPKPVLVNVAAVNPPTAPATVTGNPLPTKVSSVSTGV